jgi:hypothetical protein
MCHASWIRISIRNLEVKAVANYLRLEFTALPCDRGFEEFLKKSEEKV